MQIEPAIESKARQLLESDVRTLGSTIGIEFTVLTRDLVAATMPVDERTKQPFGILHGGASVALAESAASIGAWLNIDESQFDAVGLEINANHLKAMRSGSVIGEARPLHRGKSTHVWEVRISAAEGTLVCISRCTLAIISKRR